MKTLRRFALAVLAMPLAGQAATVEKLSDHAYAYMTDAGFTNSGFIVTDEGVVVVDTQDTVVHGEEFLAEIRKVSSKPILYVINTNFHYNHTTGNQLMAKEAKAIVSHELTRKNVIEKGPEELASMKQNYAVEIEQYEKSLRDDPLTEQERAATTTKITDSKKSLTGLDRTVLTPPSMTITPETFALYRTGEALDKATDKETNKRGLAFEATGVFHTYGAGPLSDEMAFGDPNLKGAGVLKLYLGGLEIQLLYLGRGHTEGDLIVYVPSDKVLYSGGLLFSQTLPWLRGSFIADWQKTLDEMLKLDFTKVVPGTGALSSKDDLIAFKSYLTDLYTAVKNQVDQGISKDDVRWKIDLSAYQNWANYENYLRYNIEDAFDEISAAQKTP